MKRTPLALLVLTSIKSALSMDLPVSCPLTDLPREIQLPIVQTLERQDRIHLFSTCRNLNRFGIKHHYVKMNPMLKTVTWTQLPFLSEGELVRFNLHIIKLVSVFREFCCRGEAVNGQNRDQISKLSQHLIGKVDCMNPQTHLIIGASEYYWYEDYNHTSLHLILRWLQNYATAQIKEIDTQIKFGEIESEQDSYDIIQEYLSLMRRYLFENVKDDSMYRAEIDLYVLVFSNWQPFKKSLAHKSTDIRWTIRSETTPLCPINIRFINFAQAFPFPSSLRKIILEKELKIEKKKELNIKSCVSEDLLVGNNFSFLPKWTFSDLLEDQSDISNESESDSDEYEYLANGSVKKISSRRKEYNY